MRPPGSPGETMVAFPGCRVALTGLTGRPELNDRSGIVVTVGDRVSVQLDGQGKPIAVKAQNVGFSIGSRVRVAGLVSKPELNGCEGEVVSVGERIGVQLSIGQVAVKRCNLQWAPPRTIVSDEHTAAAAPLGAGSAATSAKEERLASLTGLSLAQAQQLLTV